MSSDWLLPSWLLSAIDSIGSAGPLLYVLISILAVLVLLPATPFSVAAGLAFGFWGFPLVLLTMTTAAGIGFLISRYLARPLIADIVSRRPKSNAVYLAVEDEGWRLVLLIRLAPTIPFGLQNYIFGMTGLDFRSYILATAAGIAPHVALHISAAAMGRAAFEAPAGDAGLVVFAAGLAAFFAAVVLVMRRVASRLSASSNAARKLD